MGNEAPRLVTVVLVVSNLDRAVELYSAGFGLDLHIDDHAGPDPWTTGRHAAVSWTNGAFMHFALYERRTGVEPAAHKSRSASQTSMLRISEPRRQAPRCCTPRCLNPGDDPPAYRDLDGTSSS